MLTESNQISFDNSTFPKELIKNCRLTITGKKLDNMLATFFGLKCNICINTTCFTTISNLIKHYEEVHNTKGYVLCCGQKITRQKAMAMHMASHIQPEAFTCTICNKILTCPKILQNHIQNHLPESQRPLCCPEPTCSRRFSYYSALTAHQASHLNEEEKITHICEECGKIFGTASALSTHINKTHKVNQKDKYKYVCHICAHRFSNSGNLGYHLGTHEHKMFNQVQCPECGKWSKNKQCLAKHMTQHTEAPLSCEFCTYKSKSKQALRLHTQTHHIEGKHYSCDVCNKTFKMKCTLNAHAAQHTGERKYKCNFCEKTFVNSGNFYAHRKRMHSTKLKEFYEERDRLENEERMKMLDNQNI
ncbi:oocyte zinc finger protein XlCOF26-like [Ctenocephalides felis]|uniref:oocyte zinc finger protein XlCOF26-like n=1 Tax=Ctenocephalides felis TaxID=7515 RepID=UPI000E6E2E69|nr:oocyte zinc finger protein XlCOF26-like [Ctenocephalides felis]